jgi:hypothetical protein
VDTASKMKAILAATAAMFIAIINSATFAVDNTRTGGGI